MKKSIILLIFLLTGCDIHRYKTLQKPIVVVMLNKPTPADTLGSIMFKDSREYYMDFTGKNHFIHSLITTVNIGDTIR